MSMTEFQRLEPELTRLETYYESTRGAVARSSIPSEMYSGINGQLTLASTIINRCKSTGDLGRAVVSDVAGAAATWVRLANVAGDTLMSVQRDLDTENLWHRAWNEIAVPTVVEAKELAKDLASGGLDVLRTLAVLLGLYVALQIVKVVR